MARTNHLLLSLGAVLAFASLAGAPITDSSTTLTAASPPSLLSPTQGETLTSFGTTLRWNNPPGTSQYHLQLTPSNNDGPGVDIHGGTLVTEFTIPPPPQWYGLLPDMTYAWRVRVSDAGAFVGLDDPSWSAWAAGSFRTPLASSVTIGALAPPTAASLSTTTPTLQWADTREGVFYYEVQLSKDPQFDTNPATATTSVYWVLIHGGVSEPRNSYRVPLSFPLAPAGKYYWRVRPRIQGDGRPVAWTPAFDFTTLPGASPSLPASTPTATPTTIAGPAATSTPAPTATPAPPAGYRLAFVSRREGNDEVYLLESNGSAPRKLTSNSAAEDILPSWSLDGSKIVYISRQNASSTINFVSPDGGGSGTLGSGTNAGQPAFSPVASLFAYVVASSSATPAKTKIVFARADGTNPRDLGGGAEAQSCPAWFQSARQEDLLVFLEGDEVLVQRPGVAERTRIATRAVVTEECSLSPDGKQFVYAVSAPGATTDLWVVATDGLSQPRQLTSAFGRDGRPQWSPDGARIAFESERDRNIEIYVMNADGSGQRNLSNHLDNDYRPSWTPDSKRIAFVSLRDGNGEIYAINVDGTGLTNLSKDPGLDTMPAWAPR